MRGIATFYTIFWIVYFPTCIAFNELKSMGLVDEIMTAILIGYTFTKINTKYVVNKTKKEYYQFLLILTFFTIYGLLFGANIQKAVLRDMVQWIRPFSVIYCTWILNPQFTKKQRMLMLYSMIATMVAWFLYHPELGKEGYTEFAVLGQLAMCTGMAWYLLTDPTKTNTYIATALVLSGMMAPKFKFLGEVVCFIYVIYFMQNRLKFKSPKTAISIALMMAVVLYVTWFKFEAYYVSGFEEGAERMARPESYKVAFGQILWDYFPFGSGMGSFGCAAAADYYSPLYYKYKMDDIWGLTPDNPMFLADAFYPVLAQIGAVGIFFFCVFWKRRFQEMNRIIDMRYYKVAWITVFCLAIEQTADTSFLSGKGMGYCMLIALCLNANRNLLMERAKIRKLIAHEKKLVETLQNPDVELSLKKEK
ncbi:MAG: hypothetical protein J5905_00795 [Prevotella sp.]|nr:hypothetical protein [Prevotella sp.]